MAVPSSWEGVGEDGSAENGQGLISCGGPCPQMCLWGCSGGQGVGGQMRPCPKGAGLCSAASRLRISSLWSLLSARRASGPVQRLRLGRGFEKQGPARGRSLCFVFASSLLTKASFRRAEATKTKQELALKQVPVFQIFVTPTGFKPITF